MKLSHTAILVGGMLRCCIDTIDTLDKDADYQDMVIDCKHEKPGNQAIRLKDGVWMWNRDSKRD